MVLHDVELVDVVVVVVVVVVDGGDDDENAVVVVVETLARVEVYLDVYSVV